MIKFGPSGNCISFYSDGNKKSVEAPKWLHDKMGLTAYEYSFGRGITLSDETASEIGKEAKKYDVEISVHAPYYINLASPNEESALNSFNYITNSLNKLKLLGGHRLVVHIGSQGKLIRPEALELANNRLKTLSEIVKQESYAGMDICLEAMGKPAQIGTYQEVIEFCKLSPQFIPTLDFGHINAVTLGSLKSQEDYEIIISYMVEKLGQEKARRVHIHFSKIEYGQKGEIRHLTLDDTIYGPEFEPLAKVLKKYNIDQAVIISESKEQMAIDAKRLKEIYEHVTI